jgi:hypothetical protein
MFKFKKRNHKKRRLSRKFNENDISAQIDRLFELLRVQKNIYAFQKEAPARIDFLAKNKFPCVFTRKAKKQYFVEDSKTILIDEGLVIEYNNLSKEQYVVFRDELTRHFENRLFYKFKKNDTRNKEVDGTLSGQVLLTNWDPTKRKAKNQVRNEEVK